MSVYRYINALSLDVVAGALISSLFFAHLFESKLPNLVLIALGLAVWTVYTFDHLWDAYRSNELSDSLRHQFHRKHFTVLLTTAMAVALTGGVICLYLPVPVRITGLLLMLAVIIYFLTIHLWKMKFMYHKEILVAIIYTWGVVAGPYSLAKSPLNTYDLLVVVQFSALAFANLMLFACYEVEMDIRQGFGSLARSIGEGKSTKFIGGVLILILISAVAALLLFGDHQSIANSQWVIILMTVPLAMLLGWKEYFKHRDFYRLLGDAIFFIPLIWL